MASAAHEGENGLGQHSGGGGQFSSSPNAPSGNPSVGQKRGREVELGDAPADKKWPGWPGETVFRLIVQVQKVGSIIGRKGELVKKMCEETRARIKILEGVAGTTDRVVLITAREEPDAPISPAMDAILRVHKRVAGIQDSEGDGFEVVYYPRASTPEFCVKAKSVDVALRIQWSPGMRFKMPFETEDSSRISWFMGTVSFVQFADPVLWPNSPWRLLQVTWDEPDILQNVKRVSPWLVELVSNMPPIQMTPFPLPKKKLRVTHSPDFQLEGQGIMGLQMSTVSNNLLRPIHPWHGFSDSVPVGIQGARHDRIYGISLSEFFSNKGQKGLFFKHPSHQEQGVISSRVSTDLNIGNSPRNDGSGMQSSPSSFLTAGNSSQNEQKTSSGSGSSSTTKGSSFLLFGKPIHAAPSPKSYNQQQSGLSSSDGAAFHTFTENGSPGLTSNTSSNGNQEALERVQKLITGERDGTKLSENYGLRLSNGESLDFAGTKGIRSLQWFKDQTSTLKLEKDKLENTFEDSIVHCKVFKETEEVGRTLDLSLFCTYEQLYDRLAKMFGIEESELSNRVLYKGLGGSVRHAGDEPYKDFMKTVRRLTILSDSGSDNMAR